MGNKFKQLAEDDSEQNGKVFRLYPIMKDAAKSFVDLEAEVRKNSDRLDSIGGIVKALDAIEVVLKQMHSDFIQAIKADGKAPVKVLFTVAACLCIMSIMFTILITNTQLKIKDIVDMRPHGSDPKLDQ